MEEKIFEIISMSCEHFAGVPIKCSKRLAMTMVDMVKEFTGWLMDENNETIVGILYSDYDGLDVIDYLFNYWYNNIYKK